MLNRIRNFFSDRKAAPGRTLARPDAFLAELFGAQASAAGVSVTRESALSVPAVRAAVSLIAGSIASLEIAAYRSGEGGARVKLDPVEQLSRLLRRPNPWTTWPTFAADLVADRLLHGNAIAYAVRADGEVRELHRVDPRSTIAQRDMTSLEPSYTIQFAEGSTRVASYRDVIHLRALVAADGLNGRGAIADGSEAIGLASLLQSHAGRLFRNAAKPGGILSSPNVLSAEAVARMRDSWQAGFSAENAGRVAVLESGVKFEPLTFSAVDSEFISQRKFQVAEIARIFGLSPTMIGDLERATMNNSEEMARQLVNFTLTPLARSIEEEFERVLIPEGEAIEIELDLADFALGDVEKTVTALRAEIETGIATVNEARSKRGRGPVEGGDQPMTTIQSRPLNAPAQTQPKPDATAGD